MLALKIFCGIVGTYGAIKLSGVAIAWIKEGIDQLKPPSKRDY